MDKLNEKGLIDLDLKTQKEIDGGFVALTLFGITYSAVQVATAAGIIFAAGTAVGIAAAAN